ncbi:MAG: tyrosine-type recombinase/integrase [Nitrososphaerota archaeon]
MAKKWDKGIDFIVVYERLARLVKRERRAHNRAYAFILLIQLRNGSRVSEAVRAFREFMLTGRTEVYVPLSKKKRPTLRLMVIPEIDFNRKECADLLDVSERLLIKRVKMYALNRLKVNTHSLRYAFITYLLREGVNPSIVAKITGHAHLDSILRYTQEKEAERILRGL